MVETRCGNILRQDERVCSHSELLQRDLKYDKESRSDVITGLSLSSKLKWRPVLNSLWLVCF